MDYRRLARECAVQMLFQIDIARQTPDEVFEHFWAEKTTPQEARNMAERLVRGTRARVMEIDRTLVESASNWRIERMAIVDRSILRLAIYEFLHEPDTPRIAVIDEAIELAKRFGGEESSEFVNGVLDAVRKKLAA